MTDIKDNYKNAAITIATRICRDAIWNGKYCNWIGSSTEEFYGAPRGFAKALSTNFYDGLAGISWFLLNTALLQNNPLIEKTAKASLNQIIDQEINGRNKEINQVGQLGFYTGLPGIAFVLLHAGELLNEPAYASAAHELIKKTILIPKEYWGLDVIEGAAGAIPALIHFYKRAPHNALQQFIISLANFLIEKADKQSTGWSWNTMEGSTFNLTGFGHGAAGFAVAFAELYAFTNNKEYLDISKAAAQYENNHFNATQQNWPDYRNFNNVYQPPAGPVEAVCSMAWCHGAPGIGLARLRMFELTGEQIFKNDAAKAIDTTIKNLSIYNAGNYSMCHGIFGNAELVLAGAEILNQPEYLSLAQGSAADCIHNFITKAIPVPNGLQSGHETPDFMLGSSGIGYFFLRLTDPKKFSSMLLIK